MISWYFPLFWFPELPTPVFPDPVNCKESCGCERWPAAGCGCKVLTLKADLLCNVYLAICLFEYLCICVFVHLCICAFVYLCTFSFGCKVLTLRLTFYAMPADEWMEMSQKFSRQFCISPHSHPPSSFSNFSSISFSYFSPPCRLSVTSLASAPLPKCNPQRATNVKYNRTLKQIFVIFYNLT